MSEKTFYSRLYVALNVFCFGLAGFFIMYDFGLDNFGIASRLLHFSYGIGVAFLLLPFHEYIHVVAYKSQGARHTSLSANIKKFYFLALAHHFVADKKEFIRIALAPFLTISTLLIVGMFFIPNVWVVSLVGTLLAHTAMCSGDFGLLSYIAFHKDKEVVTFDDTEAGVSYLYGK